MDDVGCDTVARAFVDHYYLMFDKEEDCTALAVLYGQTSKLSIEGCSFAGAEDISRKLAQLPFQKCCPTISTVDCHPLPALPGSFLVFVSGSLQVTAEEHPLRFS